MIRVKGMMSIWCFVGVGGGGKAGGMTGGGGRVLSRSLEVSLVALVRETGSPGH